MVVAAATSSASWASSSAKVVRHDHDGTQMGSFYVSGFHVLRSGREVDAGNRGKGSGCSARGEVAIRQLSALMTGDVSTAEITDAPWNELIVDMPGHRPWVQESDRHTYWPRAWAARLAMQAT